jgi:hypothetical protein
LLGKGRTIPLVPCLAACSSFSTGMADAAVCLLLDIACHRMKATLTRVRGGAWPILPICERGFAFIFDVGRGTIVDASVAWFGVVGYARTHETSGVYIPGQ